MSDEGLTARIAEILGWSEKDVRSFSYAMLRELVKSKSPKLAAELTRRIQSGTHLYGET